MGNSRVYRNLEKRIEYLENTMLPHSKLSGNYTKKEQDLIRSFVVLVHAEIEYYFETRVIDKITKELTAWKRNPRKRSNCLISVMAFLSSDINWENDANAKNLEYRVNKTVVHFVNLVNKNHGIKKKNILNLVLPIGLELKDIDLLWLEEMKSFGAFRGQLAHTSSRVQSPIDRDIELNRIKTKLIPGIKTVDQDIAKL